MSHLDTFLLPALAVLLDLALGDPHAWPHPVRAVGAAYSSLERLADRMGWRSRWFGVVAVVGVAGGSGLLMALLAALPGVGWLVALYFAYAGLAFGCLWREAGQVAALLEGGDIEAARVKVAGLVSRDVSGADAADLWRALAETLSENVCDAFVAPFLFLALGGPAWLWVYKAVSTADSMWGYLTPRYARLGWFGARADDVLAYVPARLTALAMWAAGWCLGFGRGVRFGDITADAGKSKSPNAGWSMAAAAWVCQGSMGGKTVYFGQTVDKPRFGPENRPWDFDKIQQLRRVAFVSCVYVACLLLLIRYAVWI